MHAPAHTSPLLTPLDLPVSVLQSIFTLTPCTRSNLRHVCKAFRDSVDGAQDIVQLKHPAEDASHLTHLFERLPVLRHIHLGSSDQAAGGRAAPSRVWDAGFMEQLLSAYLRTSPRHRDLLTLTVQPGSTCCWTLTALRTLSAAAPNLFSLSLNLNYAAGTAPHAEFLAALPQNLQALDLTTMPRKTKALDLLNLCSLTSLTSIRLVVDALPVSPDQTAADVLVPVLSTLLKAWPRLRQVTLFDLDGALAQPDGGSFLAHTPTQTEQLSLQTTFHGSFSPPISHLSHLTLLAVFDISIPFLLAAASLPNLSQLKVYGDLQVDGEGFQQLHDFTRRMDYGAVSFPALTGCVLRRASRTLAGILGNLAPRVTVMRMDIDPFSFTQRQTLATVSHFVRLQVLCVQGDVSSFDDELAVHLSRNLKCLEHLEVTHTASSVQTPFVSLAGRFLGPVGLRALAMLPRLRHVELSGCQAFSLLKDLLLEGANAQLPGVLEGSLEVVIDGERVTQGPPQQQQSTDGAEQKQRNKGVLDFPEPV